MAKKPAKAVPLAPAMVAGIVLPASDAQIPVMKAYPAPPDDPCADGSTPDRAPTMHSDITDLGHARLLPEIGVDEPHHDPLIADGTINRFVDEVVAEDGTVTRPVMRIVADSTGALRKVASPDEVASWRAEMAAPQIPGKDEILARIRQQIDEVA